MSRTTQVSGVLFVLWNPGLAGCHTPIAARDLRLARPAGSQSVPCTNPCTRGPPASRRGAPEENARVAAHILYLVGGAPRVGKSSLAQRLLAIDGIPWLPTDVVRTVVRRVAPDVDAIDQDPVDAAALARSCTHTSSRRLRCALRKPTAS
jgi:hypothetical protein